MLSLDRINNVESCSGKFISDSTFIPADFFKYSFGITQIHNAAAQKVVLSFEADQAPYILTQPLHRSQNIILQNDQEVQVELEVYLTQELKMSILSYGQHVRVLQPEILRKEIKEIIESMKMNYK